MERSDGRRRAWSFGSVGAGMGYGDEGREGEEEEVEEDENENENEHGGKRKGKAKGKGRGREEDADVDVDGDLEMTEEGACLLSCRRVMDAGLTTPLQNQEPFAQRIYGMRGPTAGF